MKPEVRPGQIVLFVLQNGTKRPCIVTAISNPERGVIDATLFNNTERGEYANNSLLSNIPLDEQGKTPLSWHPIEAADQTRAAGAQAGSGR